jgi:NTP pyrophosphatase (non-canonical NTP hydrolase)
LKNFGQPSDEHLGLGACEEVGELAHSILKHAQGIRGMGDDDKYEAAAGDAIADTVIYLMQLCTSLRMDFETLVEETAKQVMKRDWKANCATGEDALSAREDTLSEKG